MSSQSPLPVVIPISAHLDGPTLIETARSLGRHGIPVHVVARGLYPLARRCRYIKSLVEFPEDPPDETWKQALEAVLDKIGPTSRKPLLMFCTENDMDRFAALESFFDAHFQMLPPLSDVAPYVEKDNQLPFAEQAGFLIPQSLVARTKEDLDRCVETLPFPLFAKPLARHTVGVFKPKGLLLETSQALYDALLPCMDRPPTALIVQQYVAGTDNDIYLFMGSIDKGGNVRACVTGRKLRQYPPGGGFMACGYLEKNPDFEKKCRELCRLFSRYQGFIGIECKRPPGTDDYYYIETNFRPEMICSLASRSGVDLVFDTYQAALGNPCSISTRAEKGSWCCFSQNLDATRELVRKGQMTWKDYWKPLPRPLTWSLFAWDDPGPFFVWLRSTVWNKMKRLFRCNG